MVTAFTGMSRDLTQKRVSTVNDDRRAEMTGQCESTRSDDDFPDVLAEWDPVGVNKGLTSVGYGRIPVYYTVKSIADRKWMWSRNGGNRLVRTFDDE